MSRFRRIAATISPAAVVALVLGISLAPALAGAEVWTIDPAKTTVTFELGATGLDVAGSIASPSGALEFDREAGTVSGTITIELKGAQTGNKSRDKTMHKDVLESERFPVATFGAQKLKGTVAPSGTSEVTLVGVLNLHGGEHPVEIPAKVTIEGARLAVDGSFEVPFVEWGLKDLSWFVLRVDKLVKVRIKGEGTLGAPAADVAAAGH